MPLSMEICLRHLKEISYWLGYLLCNLQIIPLNKPSQSRPNVSSLIIQKSQNQLLYTSQVVNKLAVKLNAPLNVLNAHLILIHNFHIGLMEWLAGAAEGLLWG